MKMQAGFDSWAIFFQPLHWSIKANTLCSLFSGAFPVSDVKKTYNTYELRKEPTLTKIAIIFPLLFQSNKNTKVTCS